MRRSLAAFVVGAACLGGITNVHAQVEMGGALGVPDLSNYQLEGMEPLPITGLHAIQANGELMFVSTSGRFVFSGQMTDLWTGATIDTLEQAADVTQRIDLDRLSLTPDRLNSVSFGEGETDITLFTDPLCDHCNSLIEDLRPYGDDFSFHLVVVPTLGEESHQMASHLSCAQDRSDQLSALLNHELLTLPSEEGCTSERYEMTLVAAQLLSVDGVPFLIHDDGRIFRGRPDDISAWLEGDI